ncbi:SURF1 family protein [Pseudoduganella sp. DS3]|uniref:SURF1-like protein n=1 Tax=Pseudoduganella guangdongensis TaxID=2692179 RepID=A0A6N9HLC8_9BURK|nr:SURF1 family protein [Pseudoduganella guangdongensis]MYN03495.1 SURF1 family protein [Pseudoduganella guangdongensis]
MAFRFRLIPFLATVVLVAIGVAAGRWQDGRAAQKLALEARLAAGNAAAPLALGAAPVAAAEVEFRRVRLQGEWVAGWPLYLDNRPHAGRPGFYLLMPLRLAGSEMHVLVARGWLPRDMADRSKLPAYATPAGPVTVEGIARLAPGQVMQLGQAAPLAPGAIVQNADAAAFAAATGWRFQPLVVEQATPDAAAGAGAPAEVLQRDWPAPALGVDKHKGYAFQWYALAAMAVLFFVFTGLRKSAKH